MTFRETKTAAMTANFQPAIETPERLFNDLVSCVEQLIDHLENAQSKSEKESADIVRNAKNVLHRVQLIKDCGLFSLNELAKKINKTAHEHGWWDRERSFGDIIALCHSELSESLESYRNREPMFFLNGDKPDGIATEMIDCVIRILDYLAEENIDVDGVMRAKMRYNKTREYRHGDKEL